MRRPSKDPESFASRVSLSEDSRKKYSSSTLLSRAVMGRISDDLSEEDSNSVSREKVVRRSPLNYEK